MHQVSERYYRQIFGACGEASRPRGHSSFLLCAKWQTGPVFLPFTAGSGYACADTLIRCGDSNVILQPTLDHSLSNSLPKTSAKTVRQILLTYDLVDSWRDLDFTYYSAPHSTFTRIDHIFIQTPLLPLVLPSTIRSITWCDHDAVPLTLTSLAVSGSESSWMLSEYIFADQGAQLLIRRAMQDYLTLNATPDMPPTMLWASHKAVIRGHCIQQTSILERTRRKKRESLEKDLEARSGIVGV